MEKSLGDDKAMDSISTVDIGSGRWRLRDLYCAVFRSSTQSCVHSSVDLKFRHAHEKREANDIAMANFFHIDRQTSKAQANGSWRHSRTENQRII